MKGRGGHYVGESSLRSLWTFWAKDVIERGKESHQPRRRDQDGHPQDRRTLHLHGGEKRDRPEFPVVAEARALSRNYPRYGVLWREGEPVAREDMLAFVSGRSPSRARRSTSTARPPLARQRALDGLGYLDRPAPSGGSAKGHGLQSARPTSSHRRKELAACAGLPLPGSGARC